MHVSSLVAWDDATTLLFCLSAKLHSLLFTRPLQRTAIEYYGQSGQGRLHTSVQWHFVQTCIKTDR
jgi:hypothetical protein